MARFFDTLWEISRELLFFFPSHLHLEGSGSEKKFRRSGVGPDPTSAPAQGQVWKLEIHLTKQAIAANRSFSTITIIQGSKLLSPSR